MANLISNPNAGSCYYTSAGSAITNATTALSPKVLGGAAAGLGADRSLLDNVKSQKPTNMFGGGRVYRGFQNGALSWATGALDFLTISSGKYLGFMCTSTTNLWSAGDLVSVRPSGAGASGSVLPQMSGNYLFGVHTITTGAGGNGFTTDMPYNAVINAIPVTVSRLVQDTATKFATNNQVIAARVTTKLYGSSSSALQTAGNKVGRGSVHKVVAMRTQKTQTALRAGYYNRFTGKWTNSAAALAAIAPVNDYTTAISLWATGGSATLDKAAESSMATPGQLTFKSVDASNSGKGVTTRNYSAKKN